MGSSPSEEEEQEKKEDDRFDYELHLLAMQFQKYAYRRLYISDVWLIWCV